MLKKHKDKYTGQTVQSLYAMMVQALKEYVGLRFQNHAEPIQNSSLIRQHRREIARIKTLIKQLEGK